ncbi:protocadherin Fat 3-like [Crassostrea virginica]
MITVLDENEPPVLNLDTYYVSVNEGQKDTVLPPAGFLVTDEDAGDSYTYAITSGTSFAINATTGTVTFAQDVEVTVTSTFNITVQVTDRGGLSDTCVVVITVLNVNRKPYFTNLPVTLSIPENTVSGSALYTLGLVDEDLASTVVSYTTIPVLSSNLFFYNDTDRTLYLAVGFLFDYETTPVHNLTFMANDGTDNSDPATLCLVIVNINEPPTFQSPVYYITFNENVSGTTLPSIAYNVNDPDGGDTLTYSLVAGDYLTKLGINPSTGQLHLTADLSVPNTLTSNITVQITDSNGLTSTAVVEMTITNVNNVPYFLNLPFTVNVDETISPGSVLYSVTAHDNDAVDVLSYSVAYSPTSASSLLQFDSTGNQIKLRENSTMNYQLLNEMIVVVTVQDPSGATVTSNLTINVNNVNESPQFSSPVYYGEVKDGTLGLPVTLVITAMDPDLSDTLTYSIVSQSVAGIFTINTTSGDLYTAVDDAYYKTNGNCTLLVQVEDQYGAYDQATIVVSITYVNTKPEIYNFTGNCEISEALPVGSLLAIFSVTDPNSRDVITERISWFPASAVYKFTINFSSRQLYIYLKDTIDYENENAYNLTMIFNDGHEDSTSYEVAFSVGDVNEPPSIQYSSYSMAVNESNAGTVLDASMVFTDPDQDDTTTCEIFSGNDNQYFDISPATCILSLAKDYDIDLGLPSTHSLLVRVVDSKGLSATTTVNINVLDINDNTPKFEYPEIVEFVASDSLIGYQVHKLSVNDIDSSLNAQLTCAMDGSHSTKQFALTSGCIIYQTESLANLAEGTEINFTAIVQDAGSPSLSSTALVRVIIQGTEKAPQTASSSVGSGVDFTDWELLLICGIAGVAALLGLINAVALYRKGCCKKIPTGKEKIPTGKDTSGLSEKEKAVEKNGARRDTEPNNNRRNSSQYNRRNTRRTQSLPLTTPKMETVSVGNVRCEDLERILTPTDVSLNGDYGDTGRSYISSDRSFASLSRPSRRVSDVMGPKSNFDYI